MATQNQKKAQSRFSHASRAVRRKWAAKAAKTRAANKLAACRADQGAIVEGLSVGKNPPITSSQSEALQLGSMCLNSISADSSRDPDERLAYSIAAGSLLDIAHSHGDDTIKTESRLTVPLSEFYRPQTSHAGATLQRRRSPKGKNPPISSAERDALYTGVGCMVDHSFDKRFDDSERAEYRERSDLAVAAIRRHEHAPGGVLRTLPSRYARNPSPEDNRRYEEGLAAMFKRFGTMKFADLYIGLRKSGDNHSQAITTIQGEIDMMRHVGHKKENNPMSELMIVGNPYRRKRKVKLSVRRKGKSGKRRGVRAVKRRAGKKRGGPRRIKYGGKYLYPIQIITKYGKVKGRKILARHKKGKAKRVVSTKRRGRKSIMKRRRPAQLRLTCRMSSRRR